ncbi:MAG: adenylyl-sulfate kinase, partial [Cyanobacteria bacterium J06649_11]
PPATPATPAPPAHPNAYISLFRVAPSRNGVVTIVAMISPYQQIREEIRAINNNFVEVYVNAPLETCEARDVKGLYAKARAGEIKGFTGIDDPYESPLNAEIVCNTNQETIEQSVNKIIQYLQDNGFLSTSVMGVRS